jgi:hypothetical protein
MWSKIREWFAETREAAAWTVDWVYGDNEE